MWCKMLNSIAGLDKHCLVERTAEDWERAKTQDMAKIKTRSMKVISHDIAKAFASAEDAPNLESLTSRLPEDIVSLLKAVIDDASKLNQEASPGAKALHLGTEIEKRFKKKDSVVCLLAEINLQREQAQESIHWQQWTESIQSLLDSCLDKNPSEVKDEEMLSVDVVGGAGKLELPQMCADGSKCHWEAQGAASLATWALLGHCGSPASGGEDKFFSISGLEDFGDSCTTIAFVQKKKLVMGVSSGADIDSLDRFQLSFIGRFVPVPHGQPATFMNRRLRVKSLDLTQHFRRP